ncbi:MAG: zf-TFIIB domain-containing protein [Elusimicrobia bacterium]|nr:zf-TFIIB domain-containing protein [Elusimicrobiota bacterium]
MKCPVCKKDEFVVEDMGDGLTSLHCEQCEGHWLPSFVYWKWRQRRGFNAPETASEAGARAPKPEPKGAKLCPECGRLLIKYRVSKDIPFTVDRCGNCAGVWLDCGEWAALKGRDLHDDLDYIFTSVWQAGLRKEISAGSVDAGLAKALGAADYARAKKVRDWLSEHPERSRLLAFLGRREA